jgi:hypothetical protein
VDPKSGALASSSSAEQLPAHAAFDLADVVPLLDAPISAASPQAAAPDASARLLDGAR